MGGRKLSVSASWPEVGGVRGAVSTSFTSLEATFAFLSLVVPTVLGIETSCALELCSH